MSHYMDVNVVSRCGECDRRRKSQERCQPPPPGISQSMVEYTEIFINRKLL